MKLFVALGLLSTLVVFSNAAPHCHMSELVNCATIAIDWLHSLPKRSIPETEEDVVVMCNEVTKAMDCALGYRDNCTTPLQKEILALVLEGALDLRKDFCTVGSASRTKYLAHSVCLNKVSQMDEIKDEIEYAMAIFEKAQYVDQSDVITYACCGITKVYTDATKLAADNCGQEAVKAAEELLSVAIAQVPEVICSGFSPDDDKCKGILPPPGSKPSEKAKENMFYKIAKDLLKNWLE